MIEQWVHVYRILLSSIIEGQNGFNGQMKSTDTLTTLGAAA